MTTQQSLNLGRGEMHPKASRKAKSLIKKAKARKKAALK